MKIFAQGWQPEEAPLATVCLVHGQGEHSSRYTHVAAALTQAHYNIITFDQQGHGKSQGRRGDMSNYEALLDDIGRLLDEAAHRFAGTPRFLYGHSMGGNLVLNYVLRRRPPLAGVIVTSPWLRLAFTPPAIQLKLMRLLSRLWPSFTIRSRLEIAAISRDPAVVAAYKNDPFNHSLISARQLIQVDRTGQWALDHAHRFSLPLLLMHGSADRITSVEASRQFAGQIPGQCTFKLWDGLYHETHNEPEQKAVIAFMIDWLNVHTPSEK